MIYIFLKTYKHVFKKYKNLNILLNFIRSKGGEELSFHIAQKFPLKYKSDNEIII